MILKKIKHFTLISLLSSTMIFNACSTEERALVAGLAVGAVVASSVSSPVSLSSSVYSYPYYYDRPYYNGYYHYNGRKYRHGHYYRNGNRYYNGREYRAEVGRYGHYRTKVDYQNRREFKSHSRRERERNRDY
ncbi:hypothetical protein MNB_SV-13-799 [hydrothermal vent metagenome]|uniref:Uncharacterized protein n=1 Tax=hydrothermal vent metagenome TaxID=652676 RepID=A0A1W1D1H5_9ZZZZ